LFPNNNEEVPALPILPSPILGDTLYIVELSLTNLCGTRSVSDSVWVRPQPVAVLGTDYSLGCSPTTIFLQNSSYGSPSSFFWDFNNGQTSNDSLPASIVFITQNLASDFLILLTVANTCGVDIDSALVTVLPSSLVLEDLLPQNACTPFTFSFSSSLADQTYYLWDFGDGNGGVGSLIEHTYQTAGNYTLEMFVSNF
jgi:hypothetical protein